MVYNITRSTDHKLLGHKFYGNTIDEIVTSVENVLGKFQDISVIETKIKLRDSNLYVIIEPCREGE